MQPSSDLAVSRIKVRIPFRRRELITRTRLIEALYEQLEKRLMLIIAPAGYGKTSLLVDLAQQSELPICWLSLDTLDQEPQRFLRYLIAAIAERFPNFGRDSLAALESMTSFEQDEERLLITLTNEISAIVHEHFLLILDDYHLVANVTLIGHVISRLLQLAGENVHLILASRNLPDLPDSPLLIAHNQVGGLTFEDLAFQSQEIQQLFQQNNGILLSGQDARTLVEQTEGWIAAIHLTNGNPGTLPRIHPLESTRELFDFFSREVLHKQPEPVRRFLLMTSGLDIFDTTLCENVLAPLLEGEQFDWPLLFETVRTGNLFSVPLDNEGRWMRYHHLFQHFLKSQLQYEQPVLAWHIQRNLAQAYEKQQAWEEALQVYDRLDDQDNQVRLLIQIGPVFIRAGRVLTLANWLNKLPDDLVYSQPVLLSLLGIVHTTRGDNHRALELYNLAETRLRDTGNEVEWAATLVRRAEVCRQLGRFESALEDVGRIFELTQDPAIPDMQATFAEAQRIKGLALFGLGHMQDALVWLKAALDTCRRLGIKNNIPILETELGVVHRRLGEPEITARYYASALQALEGTGNTGWKARLLNNMGLLQHLTGHLDDAYRLLGEALQTAERSGYVRIQTNVLISLGDLLVDLSDLESAYQHYDRALTLATNLGHSSYIFYASLGEARLQRLYGEPLLAIDELKHTAISQVNLGIYERALYNLELGCCWLDANKVESAVMVLREAVALFGEGGNLMEQAIARLWLEAALSGEAPEVANIRLKELVPAQREWQKPTPLMINAGRAGSWLKKRGDNGLFKDPIIKIFFEHAQHIQESLLVIQRQLLGGPDHRQPDILRLEIQSFGNVQVRHNQKMLAVSDWQTREARDLFFLLLQSKPLTKEQVALAFWPDISPARLKMRFKINIYRIRQALGQDVIVFENERYRFNRAIQYSWDREKFDELWRSLQTLKGAEKIQPLEKALEILQGPYLADLDAEWAIVEQLQYQDILRELILELAALYLQNERARDCLNMARLLLRSEPLLEAVHRLIIQAYASLHDPAGMILQYRQYQQSLKAELGMQPSAEMNDLLEQLLDGI